MHQDAELSWLAGLFDGEGCFSLYRRMKKGKGWDYFVQLSNSDPIILRRAIYIIGSKLGGYYPYVRVDKPRGSRRPCYCVVVNSKEKIIEFIDLLLPYLAGTKHHQGLVLRRAILEPEYRAQAVEVLSGIKNAFNENYEEILQGLRSVELRNDYRVSPNKNPGTSA